MILLLGASGYIGSQFFRELSGRKLGFVCADRNSIGEIIHKIERADLVINCAAKVCAPSVDLNEDCKAETIIGNLVLPSQLAAICESECAPLLHVSTGCLYNSDFSRRQGVKLVDSQNHGAWGMDRFESHKFQESDEPMFSFDTGAGTYVASKELAERVVRKYERHYICRVRLPFDEFDNERNLLSKLQRYPRVVDERQSIAHRGDFVKACLELVDMKAPYGTYNCTNPGAVRYRDACDLINKKLHGGKRDFQFVTTDQFDKTTARTPKSRAELSTDKLLATGVKMRPAWEAIEDSLDKWRWENK